MASDDLLRQFIIEMQNFRARLDSIMQNVGIKPIPQRIESLESAGVKQGQVPAFSSSPVPMVEVPFDGHLWIKASEPLSFKVSTYNLPHPVDYVILQGTYDYTFEVDNPVTDTTPVTDAHIYAVLPLKVKKYIQYKLSPDVVANLGESVSGDFYIFMYWRGNP
jgi:hypothetical protein